MHKIKCWSVFSEIPYQFKHLDDGSRFLQYNSGEDDNRIHMFATNQGLNDLKQYKNWYNETFIMSIMKHLYDMNIQ